MDKYDLLLLEGDGIGPEIMVEARKVIDCLNEYAPVKINVHEGLIGGAAIDSCGDPLPQATLDLAKKYKKVLLACVGGPKYDALPREKRPEAGLLRLRKELELFANVRPAAVKPCNSDQPHNMTIVRELAGGLYYGEPRGIENPDQPGERRSFNTMVYSDFEIKRIAEVAFNHALATGRRKVCSVDKANVLEVSQLWRTVVNETHTLKKYENIELSHMYVDNAAMQLALDPTQFDILLTGNLFGDILSDLAAGLSGSIGLLPSASIGDTYELYEPIHGSAPEIAGKNIANPIALILSLRLLLSADGSSERCDVSLGKYIKSAVYDIQAKGMQTRDTANKDEAYASTAEMGNAIVDALTQRLKDRRPDSARL